MRDAGNVALFRQRAEVVEDLLADGQDLALESVLIADRQAGGDDRLADHRHGFDNGLAETGQVGRHIAPADHGLAFLRDDLLEVLDDILTCGGVAGQETHGDGVTADRGQ